MHQEASRLRGNVHGISLMAAVAPLLGLLGTVLGIAEAFATVEQTGLGVITSYSIHYTKLYEPDCTRTSSKRLTASVFS